MSDLERDPGGEPLRRWSEGGGPAGIEDLLRAARKTNPSIQHIDGVGTRLGLPASRGLGRVAALGAVGGLLALGLVGASVLVTRPEGTTPQVAPASASAPVPPVPKVVSVRLEAPSATAATEPSTSRSVARKVVLQKPSELELLRDARAVATKEPRKALALLEKHRALYPKGQLVEEREMLAIRVHRALGNDAEATKRAASFEVEYPGSAHREPSPVR